MWIRLYNKTRYGYLTYRDSCQNQNGFKVLFDGLFFVRTDN